MACGASALFSSPLGAPLNCAPALPCHWHYATFVIHPLCHTYTHTHTRRPGLWHTHTPAPLTQKLVAGLNRIIASRSESSSLEGTGENHDARISLQHHPAMSNLDAWFHGLASDQPLRDLLLRSVRLGAPKRAGRRLISIPNPMPLCVAAVLQDASRVHSAASEGRRSHPTRSRLH
jgi:hypothetical protein